MTSNDLAIVEGLPDLQQPRTGHGGGTTTEPHHRATAAPLFEIGITTWVSWSSLEAPILTGKALTALRASMGTLVVALNHPAALLSEPPRGRRTAR
jgi:hypothetical protein